MKKTKGVPVKTKLKVKKKNGACVYCHCDNPLALTVDHKNPRSRGGTDEEANLQTCCWMCNQLKGSLNHEEFKKYLKALAILRTLAKVRIEFPPMLKVRFHPHYYPEFKHNENKEAKKNG